MFTKLYTKKELIVIGIAVGCYVIHKMTERFDKENSDTIEEFEVDDEE